MPVRYRICRNAAIENIEDLIAITKDSGYLI